jgi:serine/threonine-protein kinase
MNTMKAVVKEPAPAPSSVNPDVPPGLDALVLKALEKRRGDRFASCGEFQAALEDFVIAERLPATTRHLSLWMGRMFPEELAASQAPHAAPATPAALPTPTARRRAVVTEPPRLKDERSQGGRSQGTRLVPRKK